MNKLDEGMTPKAIGILERMGHEVFTNGQIEYDAIVNGKTEEWKFLQRTYDELYLELLQCADPLGCRQCKQMQSTMIQYGWAHRDGYCQANNYRWFWGCPVIRQMAWAERLPLLDWVWDDRLKNNKVHKMVSSWEGRHRTLGLAIPFYSLPVGLVEVTKL